MGGSHILEPKRTAYYKLEVDCKGFGYVIDRVVMLLPDQEAHYEYVLHGCEQLKLGLVVF